MISDIKRYDVIPGVWNCVTTSEFVDIKQSYLNKNKGLKQKTILELYSKTSFVNVR